jgi:3-methyladenine DNA glycosylase Tag
MEMRRFDEIIDLAAERHGGRDTFDQILAETRPLAPQEIAAIPDDRILAAMTRRIFCAGFSSKVIDAKWQAFESAFERFDPARCAWMTEERFDELLKDKDIVRNGAKIKSVQENGRFLTELAEKHGTAARFLAEWPDDDFVGLLDFSKRMGAGSVAKQECISCARSGSQPSSRCPMS